MECLRYCRTLNCRKKRQISPIIDLEEIQSTCSTGTASVFDLLSLDEQEDAGEIISNELLRNPDLQRRTQMMKMLVVVCIPIIALVAMAGLSITTQIRLRTSSKETTDQIGSFFEMDDLVISLEVERGMTASYLSSLGYEGSRSWYNLMEARHTTDTHFEQDPVQGKLHPICNKKNNETCRVWHSIQEYRAVADAHNYTVEESIRKFTEVINTAFRAEMVFAQNSFLTFNRTWRLVMATYNLVVASDALGVQRALGGSFFLLCKLPASSTEWFYKVQGKARSAIRNAMLDQLRFQVDRSLQKYVETREHTIFLGNYTYECQNQTNAERQIRSEEWFNELSFYISSLKRTREMIRVDIEDNLDRVLRSATSSQTALITTVTLVLVLCALLSIWYVTNVNKLILSIATDSREMLLQNESIKKEKRKTDILLYQMLPKPIAIQLVNGYTVVPEHFEDVSIYFSDIAHFDEVCVHCEPMEVVQLLNKIYRIFDRALEMHNVYKVETIGAAYMVASGLPARIHNHQTEVAGLALTLRVLLSECRVPGRPDERLLLRAGIHCGPVVAGVVGVKMPRYCLFGDTVNTASRIQRSGMGNKIHLSEKTKLALQYFGGFDFSLRGMVTLKGKGTLRTYWLAGRSERATHGQQQSSL